MWLQRPDREKESLLKQLKEAYEYYCLDKINEFDSMIEGIVLQFTGDPSKIREKIKRFLEELP
jgi:hypothetical protein